MSYNFIQHDKSRSAIRSVRRQERSSVREPLIIGPECMNLPLLFVSRVMGASHYPSVGTAEFGTGKEI